MEISRYAQDGVRIIEVRGPQGTVFITSPGEGQSPEVAWFRRGTWKQEQALLDLSQRHAEDEQTEPFKELLLNALEIARQWKYNATYYYKFSEKKPGASIELPTL